METSKDFDLKKSYAELRKQYTLPSYEALSQDFDVEKLGEKETEFLAREIRRVINEKITAYVHLFETLINPNGPPMFVFKILKNISAKEKECIQEFYKELTKIQIRAIGLDVIYSEKNEIKYINEVFKIWQETKLKIYNLFESFEANFENGDTLKGQSYFD